MRPLLNYVISKAVQDALLHRKPVVALESTIITHGMPFPQNLKTAIEVEDIVKKYQSVPATIALMDGKIHVGLDENQLERLAKSTNAVKTSRRDLSLVLSQKLIGATTVSATMIAANQAGCSYIINYK